MTIAIIFIVGLILGSFLSVLFSRLEIAENGRRRKTKPRKKSRSLSSWRTLLLSRSRCDHCRRQIPWYDNIPLVSFALLGGRCRYCRKPISHYHPVLELSAGLYLVASYLAFGFTPQFFVAALFGLILLLIYAYDLRHQLIPDVFVIPAIVLALLLVAYQFVTFYQGISPPIGLDGPEPVKYLLGGIVFGGLFLVMSLLSGGTWIGGGDIKLGLLLGLLLGWPQALVALVLAYLIGSIYAISLLLTRQATLKSFVPFGPMLVLAFFITEFYGVDIVTWYQGLVL